MEHQQALALRYHSGYEPQWLFAGRKLCGHNDHSST